MKNYCILTLMTALIVPYDTGLAAYAPVELNNVVYTAPTIEQIIVSELKKRGYSNAVIELIVAQSKHETAGFTSIIMWENHNLFGMKMPRKRQTTAIGVKYGHAVYHSFEDSVLDYCYYLEFVGCPYLYTDETIKIQEWVIWLKNKHYFEDNYKTYYKGVKHFFELYDNMSV